MEDITPVIGGKVPRRWAHDQFQEKIRVRLSGPLHSVLLRGIPVIISFRAYAQDVPNDIRNINELSEGCTGNSGIRTRIYFGSLKKR